MSLLRSQFAQAVYDLYNRGARVFLQDYDPIDSEKYFRLKATGRARLTWFFRVDFLAPSASERYLFWYAPTGYAIKQQMENVLPVSLMLAREHPERPHFYPKLDDLDREGVLDHPDLREITYDPSQERFVSLYTNGVVLSENVSDVVRKFLLQVEEQNF